MAPSEIDFYKVLGITRQATEEEIKKAFRKAGVFFPPPPEYISPAPGRLCVAFYMY